MPRPVTVAAPLTRDVTTTPAPSGAGARRAPVSVGGARLGYACAFDPLGTRRLEAALKRLVDLTVASALLLLLLPLLLVVAVMVRLDSAGPVFFGQARVGRDLRLFRMWKFRSMLVGSELERAEVDRQAFGFPLHKAIDDPRTTRVGRILRRWSLDELPQLWNVVRGDMSLVGPRPRLPEEVLADGLRQSLRLGMRPGATGPWQIGGRSDLPYADGVALDLGYVKNWTLAMDIGILARTPWAIVRGKGAY